MIEQWKIKTPEIKKQVVKGNDYYESIFAQGNGYMGVRGFSPIEVSDSRSQRTVFLSGFYEYIRTGITDMVNQPDFTKTRIAVDGVDVNRLHLIDKEMTLHMDKGILEWNYQWESSQGAIYLRMERIISQANDHLALLRLEVRSSYQAEIKIETGIEADVMNQPVSDDQLSENERDIYLWERWHTEAKQEGGSLQVKSTPSGLETKIDYRVVATEGELTQSFAGEREVMTNLQISAKAERTYIVDKIIGLATSRDRALKDGHDLMREKAVTPIKGLLEQSYDHLREQHINAWERTWQAADQWRQLFDENKGFSDIFCKMTDISGNTVTEAELMGAIRYNIFQLIQTAPKQDEYASIGARGLMHGRYKGCVFWDTEIFMLPFFVASIPKMARNMLMYRYHTLEAALKGAKNFNLEGARYSWMSSNTGAEQCETWDTGACEIHVTADIAYAINHYLEETHDLDFFVQYAAEMYIQIARYWVSRFTYIPSEDNYYLLFVKGPDEYCGVTHNNYYTIKMASHSLLLAEQAVARMKQDDPKRWQQLKQKLDFVDAELKNWQTICEKTKVKQDPVTKIITQDDSFWLLEPFDIEQAKAGEVPAYKNLSYDRLQRYQVLKQPDVLMAMALFPEQYAASEIRANWDYYEPKTLHDSTLSYGIHALIAARLGIQEKALSYFYKCTFLDLHDIMGNTATEGIHTASLGACWQALVFGFGKGR